MIASSWAGMPSVMHTMKVMPPSAASMIAAAANFGGTTTKDAVAPVAATASLTRVEDGDAVDVAAALAGRDAADDFGAVVAVAQAVESALPAGESLDDHLGVLVNENAHVSSFRRSRGRRRVARRPASWVR